MKSLFAGVWLSIFLISGADAQVQVTCQKKKAGEGETRSGHGGDTQKGSEKVVHQVMLTNTSIQDLANLEVRYLIFVKRERIGEKRGVEGKDHTSGHETIEMLKKGEHRSFDTVEVELSESAVVGNVYYANGGKLRAHDSISGVWIKVFQNDKVIAEYANPSTVKTREKWEGL